MHLVNVRGVGTSCHWSIVSCIRPCACLSMFSDWKLPWGGPTLLGRLIGGPRRSGERSGWRQDCLRTEKACYVLIRSAGPILPHVAACRVVTAMWVDGITKHGTVIRIVIGGLLVGETCSLFDVRPVGTTAEPLKRPVRHITPAPRSQALLPKAQHTPARPPSKKVALSILCFLL